jgi:hypothetical protein
MVLLGEALDAGLVSPWGEVTGPLPSPEPDVAADDPAAGALEPDRAALAQEALAAEKKARPRRAARNAGAS